MPRVNYAENIHSIIILGDNNYCLFYRDEPQEVISVSSPDLSPVAPPYSPLSSPIPVWYDAVCVILTFLHSLFFN